MSDDKLARVLRAAWWKARDDGGFDAAQWRAAAQAAEAYFRKEHNIPAGVKVDRGKAVEAARVLRRVVTEQGRLELTAAILRHLGAPGEEQESG